MHSRQRPFCAQRTEPSDENPADCPEAARRRMGSIVESLAAPIRATQWRMLRNVHEVDDASQEALLQVFDALAGDKVTGSVNAFARRIAVHTAVDVGRRRRRYAPLDGVDVAAPLCEELERRERDEALARAVGRLPEESRAAIILHYWEGMSVRKVAAELHEAYGTVRDRLARAAQELRVALREWRED
jgi:RNA polymerase sigma factor (sigma-70 family)